MVLSDKSDSYLENFLANLRFYFLPGANFFFLFGFICCQLFIYLGVHSEKKNGALIRNSLASKKFVVGIQLFGVVQKGDLSGI